MTFLAFPEGGFQLGHATDAPIPGIWNVRMEDSRVQGRQGIQNCFMIVKYLQIKIS